MLSTGRLCVQPSGYQQLGSEELTQERFGASLPVSSSAVHPSDLMALNALGLLTSLDLNLYSLVFLLHGNWTLMPL